MLDIKFIRENPDLVKQALIKRNNKFDLNLIIQADDSRRVILNELEALRAEKNKANDEITGLLKAKKEAKDIIASMKSTAQKIDLLEEKLKIIDADL
ncbi:MAG: serine--tRNA ligase, partial [Candidatus Omnitrophica bacterium]|nr:serine--tRNA ligase [Candidatus Omnitrophota bacterium]